MGANASVLGPTFVGGRLVGATLAGVALTGGTLVASALARRELGGGGASAFVLVLPSALALALVAGLGLWLCSAGGVTSADGTVEGVRSLFASGAFECVAVSGRTDTGGGVLVLDAGRGAALTDGTLAGGMLGATGRWLTGVAGRTLAGAGLTSFARGATLVLAERGMMGDLAVVTLAAGGFALGAGGFTLGDAGFALAGAGFALVGAGFALATGGGAAFGAGTGFGAIGSSSSHPESMSSSAKPMSRKGTPRWPAYGRARANRVESANTATRRNPSKCGRPRRRRTARVSGVIRSLTGLDRAGARPRP
jgi:hypothetical protein